MCGIRRREMKMVLVLLWAAGAIVLGIGVFELFLTGSLGEILKKEETKTMLAQVLAVFLWNLLWLSRVKNRKAQIHHLTNRKIKGNIADCSCNVNVRIFFPNGTDHFHIHGNSIF